MDAQAIAKATRTNLDNAGLSDARVQICTDGSFVASHAQKETAFAAIKCVIAAADAVEPGRARGGIKTKFAWEAQVWRCYVTYQQTSAEEAVTFGGRDKTVAA